MSREYWIDARDAGQRQVDYANSMLGDEVDDQTRPELLGEHPPLVDRHLRYEADFNALVEQGIRAGRVSRDVGEVAMIEFHVYMFGTRFEASDAQTSPTFYQ